jgi:Anti-sigma factor NepR
MGNRGRSGSFPTHTGSSSAATRHLRLARVTDYAGIAMTIDKDLPEGYDKGASDAIRTSSREHPDWADGLRRLYDSVVDEPLPDSFRDLLDKLDQQG